MKILVQDKQGVRALEPGFADEKELQTFLRENSDLMPTDEIEVGTPPLLCIGWEVGVASGSQDLLYIDETGLLTIVETKLKKNPEARREVVGQILEYASDASAWTASEVEAKAQKFYASKECPPGYEGKTLEEALRRFLELTDSSAREGFSYEDFLNQVSVNLQHGHIRLIIAIDETPPSLLRTVEFVNRFSERFEMYLIQLKRFHDEATGQNIFVPPYSAGLAVPAGRLAACGTRRDSYNKHRIRPGKACPCSNAFWSSLSAKRASFGVRAPPSAASRSRSPMKAASVCRPS